MIPVVIGIAVDDTIHFLTHYKMEMENCGNVKEALSRTLHEVGQAVIFTSIILSSGLLFMTYATSIPNGTLGRPNKAMQTDGRSAAAADRQGVRRS